MKHCLYIVPNLRKYSGGPVTRISIFKDVFSKQAATIFEGKTKLKVLTSFEKFELSYVESASNRLNFIDLLPLLFLRFRSKKVIVFIRDIYIELFPEEYKSFRGIITLFVNRLSNFYLTFLSTSMVFPTEEMGRVFFERNNIFPKRPYTDLPPGTYGIAENVKPPNFSKKIGVLYLGSLGYTNSGYKNFLEFSKKYKEHYHFFILSGDKDLALKTKGYPVVINKIPRAEIPKYIEDHNIAYAFHTRPRNTYDDLTFPIKVLDFLSFQLPFFSEEHIPIVALLSNHYPLFVSYSSLSTIDNTIKAIGPGEYIIMRENLKKITIENTYDSRYKKLLSLD